MEKFIDFLCEAITAREAAKFEFTKNLSLILDSVQVIAKKCSISREDIAYVSIDSLTRWKSQSISSTFATDLKREINKMKKKDAAQSGDTPSFIYQ